MSDSQLYSRLLLPRGHGYPLFHPQPYDDLCDIRKTGTEIGDVGVVKDGCFDVLFNICHPADHPINRRFDRGLPDGFERLELSPASIAPHASYHPPGADISNTRINKRRLDIDAGVENNVFLPAGAGAVVEISSSSKETAVLLLPDGASRWDLRPLRVFKDYAIKHARSWYNWVNGRLGWEVESGDLYLITGMDKSSTWSVLATENRSEDVALSLKLKAAQLASAGGSCSWEWESASSFANSGPRRQPGWEVPDGSPIKDQTVFLRGYKVAMRSSSWIKSPKTLSIVESKPSHILSKSGFVPKISQTKSSNASHTSVNPSSRGGASNEDSEGSVEQFPRTSKMYHPSDVINDFLLNSSPTADVAITHDDEWMSMVHADEKMPDDSKLLERISRRYQPYTVSGAVFLDETFTPKKKALLGLVAPAPVLGVATSADLHDPPFGSPLPPFPAPPPALPPSDSDREVRLGPVQWGKNITSEVSAIIRAVLPSARGVMRNFRARRAADLHNVVVCFESAEIATWFVAAFNGAPRAPPYENVVAAFNGAPRAPPYENVVAAAHVHMPPNA